MNLLEMIAVGTLLGALGGTSCPAGEQPPSTGDVTPGQIPEFDRLLTGLSSQSFIQRDWAARRLTQLGPDVVPLLVAAAGDLDDETAAAAAIRLLVQMSHDPNLIRAAPALRGLTSLHDNHDRLPDPLRQLVAQGLQQATRHSLSRLMALGADIDRDREHRISRISIRSERFTDRHMLLLAPFTTVIQLDLRGTQITDEGLVHLASLENLVSLNLTDTQVTGAGLRRLPPLPKLSQLIIYRIALSEDDVKSLREKLPHCEIRRSQ